MEVMLGNNGTGMTNEIKNAIFISSLFPPSPSEKPNSGRKLKEPRELYSSASLQHPLKWPIECQVIADKIEHLWTCPKKPEPFYMSTNTEPQPGSVGEEMGTIIYDYQPKLSVDYFCQSCVGGSELLSPVFETDANSLSFESRFESGNLARVLKITNVYYELYLRPDMYTDRHAQWFYFRIKNVKEGIVYRFSIVNLSKPDSLYKYGMKPLMYSEKEAELTGVGWSRCGYNISYYKNDITSNDNSSFYTLTFNIKFSHNDDTIFIAQSYPYTYTNLQNYLQWIQNSKPKANVCKQRLLCKSLAGNNVYVLTITEPTKDSFEKNEDEESYKKQVVVLTARVHPGESPSSYMMKGIIDFLISDNPHAQTLREKFIFKIIPMLNPDGVIVGNSRCCLLGQDLNRQYRTVLREAFPQIYQTKVLLRRLVDENGIFLYTDIHSHSRKNNVFMYGCENRRVPEKRLLEQVFPLMMHKNAADKFSFQNCKFRIQKSKEGTGRIFVWTLGVANSFTLEISLCGSTLVSRQQTHFNIGDYEGLGRHFCETLLDYSNTDPAKEKTRQRIIEKLISCGSTADEPVNIPISDYSSLSHSESDGDDESEFSADDDLKKESKKKVYFKRRVSIRSSKSSLKRAGTLSKMEKITNSTCLSLISTENDNNFDKRQKRSQFESVFVNDSTSTSTTFSEKNSSKTVGNHIYFGKNSRTEHSNIVIDDPFRVPGKEEIDENDGQDQTEDECDYLDSELKNSFFNTRGREKRDLISGMKFMTLGPTVRPIKPPITFSQPPQNSQLSKNKPNTIPPSLKIINERRRKSVPSFLHQSKNCKPPLVHQSRSADEKNVPKTNKITTSAQKYSKNGFLQVPDGSNLNLTKRRVSWAGGAENKSVSPNPTPKKTLKKSKSVAETSPKNKLSSFRVKNKIGLMMMTDLGKKDGGNFKNSPRKNTSKKSSAFAYPYRKI